MKVNTLVPKEQEIPDPEKKHIEIEGYVNEFEMYDCMIKIGKEKKQYFVKGSELLRLGFAEKELDSIEDED